MKMADISTEKVVLYVKNEGTDIYDHMGFWERIMFVWEVRIPKIACFYYKFRQRTDSSDPSIVVQTMEKPPPP